MPLVTARRRFDADGIIRRHWPALYKRTADIEPIGPRTYVVTDYAGELHRCQLDRHGDPLREPCDIETVHALERIEWMERTAGFDAPAATTTVEIDVPIADGVELRDRITFSFDEVDSVCISDLWGLHWRREGEHPDRAEHVPEDLALEEIDHWIASRLLEAENTPNQHDWR